jgi:integrase
MDGVKLPAPVERPVKAWNAHELVQLVRAARGFKYEAWFWLSVGTGLRLGESRALLWSDLNLDAKTVTISKSIDTRTNLLGPTKSGRTRVVDVPDEVMQILSAHRKRQPPSELYVIGSRQVGRKRAPVLAMALNRWLYRLCVRAGVKVLSPHSCRHTFATLALEAGVPLKEISEALGHANVAITATTYSHAVEVRRRRAATAIGAALTAQPSPLRLLKAADGTPDGTRGDV